MNNDINLCFDEIINAYHKFNEKIDTIVIGYLLYPSCDKSPMCLVIDNFKQFLVAKLPSIKFILFDERKTTLEANSEVKNIGLKFSKIKRKKDKIANSFRLLSE